jgi:hypothetical protein
LRAQDSKPAANLPSRAGNGEGSRRVDSDTQEIIDMSNNPMLEREAVKDKPEDKHESEEAARRRRREQSLESGLEDTFPASDPISIVQPPPSALDKKNP